MLGCIRVTSAKAMRYTLYLPPMADRHKLAQVKAFTCAAADIINFYSRKLSTQSKPDSREELSGLRKPPEKSIAGHQ